MAIMLEIKVSPGAKKQLIKPDPAYDMRCYVTAQPENNKANQAVITLIADALAIPKRAVTIVSGATTRIKRIEIVGFASKDEIFAKLNFEVQRGLF